MTHLVLDFFSDEETFCGLPTQLTEGMSLQVAEPQFVAGDLEDNRVCAECARSAKKMFEENPTE